MSQLALFSPATVRDQVLCALDGMELSFEELQERCGTNAAQVAVALAGLCADKDVIALNNPARYRRRQQMEKAS